MRIIFLNIWHGQAWDKLQEFIAEQSKQTDIFCFMEIDPTLQAKLESVLTEFMPVYEKGIKTNYFGGITEGRSTFVGKKFAIKERESKSVYRNTKNDAGGLQYLELSLGNKRLFVGNVHGKARPGHKMDTPARIKQSEKTIDFFKDKKGLKIIGGDFNLLPDTKSVEIFEKSGYRNLIKDFKVKTTRNKLSWDQFGQKADFEKQYFADYVFVSPEVKVKSFEVPEIEVSDHLPLILDFEI